MGHVIDAVHAPPTTAAKFDSLLENIACYKTAIVAVLGSAHGHADNATLRGNWKERQQRAARQIEKLRSGWDGTAKPRGRPRRNVNHAEERQPGDPQ